MEKLKSDLSGGALLIGFAVMVLWGVANWFTNVSVYSEIARYYGLAREINTLLNAVLFISIALIANRKPAWLDHRTLLLVSSGCLITGTIVSVLAMRMLDPAFTVIGFGFSTIARIWGTVLTCLVLYSLASPTGVLLAVGGGTAASGLITWILPTPNPEMAIILNAVFMALCFILLYRRSCPLLDRIASGPAAADVEVANPESFIGPLHPLYTCALFFNFAGGYALAFEGSERLPVLGLGTGLAMAIVVALMIALKDEHKTDNLFSYAVIVVLVGFASVPLGISGQVFNTNTFLRMGSDAFTLLIWMVAIAMGKRNIFALLPTFCILRAIMSLGTTIGAVAGHWSNTFAEYNVSAVNTIAIATMVVFVAFLWVGFRRFSFEETINGVVGIDPATVQPNHTADTDLDRAKTARAGGGTSIVETVGETTGDVGGAASKIASECATRNVNDDTEGALEGAGTHDPIDDVCDQLADSCGLTEREREILGLLARGRNGRFIMEHDVISRNTAKTHIRHIYQKLDVHSQQELIDLVETEQTSS